MSILLVGAQGQVGQELKKTLLTLDPTFGELVAVDRSQLDLTDLEAIATKVADVSPQLIVNAAAYTAVDKAESEPALAQRINAEAPETLAKAAVNCGAAMVHISTDYVFSGQVALPRQEADPVEPLSVYGRTKLAGEAAIRSTLDRHIILRTAWVYGVYGKGNFLKTMLRLARDRTSLSVVADQVGSPTWAKDIADAIAALSLQIDSQPGTYHFTNRGTASWHAFAEAIFEEAKALNIPLAVETVQPITTAEYPTPAQRPPYSVLDCRKITKVLGYEPPQWRASLKTMLKQYLQENPQILAQTVQ